MNIKPRKMLLIGALAVVVSAAPVHLTKGDNQIAVDIGGKPFTTYYFDPKVAKPYLMPLRTAHGIIISRNFPVGNDASLGDSKASSFEPHQRPLYFAHGDIDGLDFWGEAAFNAYYSDHARQDYGHSTLEKVDDVPQAPESGVIRASFTLQDPNGRAIGEETQTFTFPRRRKYASDRLRICSQGHTRANCNGRHKGGYFWHSIGPRFKRATRAI